MSNHKETNHDELQKCKRNVIRLVRLILSDRSREAMRFDVLKFLMENSCTYMGYMKEMSKNSEGSANSRIVKMDCQNSKYFSNSKEVETDDGNGTDELGKCNKDIVHLVRLILSEKSVDTLKFEVMQVLMDNKQIYLEYMTKLTGDCKTDFETLTDESATSGKSIHEPQNINKSLTSSTEISKCKDINKKIEPTENIETKEHKTKYRSEKQKSNPVKRKRDNNGGILTDDGYIQKKTSSQTYKKKTKKRTSNHEKNLSLELNKEKGSTCSSKQAKSIQQKSKRQNNLSDQVETDGIFLVTNSTITNLKQSPVQKQYSEIHDDKSCRANEVINILVNSKSKQEQNVALEMLRKDDVLRTELIKKASQMKNIKIPVFHEQLRAKNVMESKITDEDFGIRLTEESDEIRTDGTKNEIVNMTYSVERSESSVNLMQTKSSSSTYSSLVQEPGDFNHLGYNKLTENMHKNTMPSNLQIQPGSISDEADQSAMSICYLGLNSDDHIYNFSLEEHLQSVNNLLSIENADANPLPTDDILHL